MGGEGSWSAGQKLNFDRTIPLLQMENGGKDEYRYRCTCKFCGHKVSVLLSDEVNF